MDPTGRSGPTRGQRVGPGWRRTTPGLYVPAGVGDDLVEQRILEQSMRMGSRAVVTGWAALRLLGGGFFDGFAPDGTTSLPVPIAANGKRVRAHEQIRLVRDTVPPDEVVVVQGIRCAGVHRALYDEMRRRGLGREGTVAADMVFAAELTSLRRMQTYTLSRRWFRDIRGVAACLTMCDEGSLSPQETRFRLIWEHDARWGRPLCNRAVIDLDGCFLGIPDLLDPHRGVVGEYAGAHHRDRDRHRSDVRREDLFRRAGLEYVETVGADLRDERLVVERMHAAESRAGLVPKLWRLGPAGASLDERLGARERGWGVE
ncbi:hypothetical protein [Nocardioides psychrotolerans]|uniref:hypothetical protein n=1 Tax=Nocardioides psychrotolerans TaxID=1005945 RepID=UPI001160D84C|nr:hypothetical protein [Nocardioides psychrotolerans]